jgi:transcriptional regulator with XRE-family HTH domain
LICQEENVNLYRFCSVKRTKCFFHFIEQECTLTKKGGIALAAIGSRIKALRKKVRLTQAELAEKIGTHEVTLRRWENSNVAPDSKILLKMASALGVDVTDILDDPEEGDEVDGLNSENFKVSAMLDDKNSSSLSPQKDMLYRYTKNGETHSLEILFYAQTPKEEKLEMVEQLLKKTFGERQ